jgi:hypothetical protein
MSTSPVLEALLTTPFSLLPLGHANDAQQQQQEQQQGACLQP